MARWYVLRELMASTLEICVETRRRAGRRLFLVFIFVAFRFHFLGRTFLTSSNHSEFKMLFLVQGHFLEYITSLNVV